MSIVTQNDTFVEYKYSLEEFYIMIGSETIKLPTERITNIIIENYFDNASFPIFKVTCMLEPSRYYKIVKYKDTVKFKVRLQQFYRKNGEDNKSLMTDAINDTFALFMDDDNEDYQKYLKKEANTLDDINQLDKVNNKVELFLFKDGFVTGLRSTFNTVLNGVDMCTAATYLLYKAGVRNVLMSPFENTRVYGTLILPPQSIENQLKYLNNNYGFHKEGTMIYFGLNNSYVLNCKAGCTAWKKGEYKETSICVLDRTNPTSLLSGAILKKGDNKYYYNVKVEGIDIAATTMSTNVLTGTDACAIDMKSSSTTSVSSNSLTRGSNNSTILFNDSSNPYMAKTYAAQQHANSTVITLAMENVNMDGFTPNKAFSIIFEDATLNKKYKGTYRISSSVFNLNGTGLWFNSTSAIVLKKVT
jgi:hypothetical protein